MRKSFLLIRAVVTLLLCSVAVAFAEESISISGGNPGSDQSGESIVVYIKLTDDGTYFATISQNNQWTTSGGHWTVEDKALKLLDDTNADFSQDIRFNNGTAPLKIGGRTVHINLTEEARQFFEKNGGSIPDGMPGERITPTPSPTPGPTPTPTAPPTPTPTPEPVTYDSVNGVYKAVVLEVTADSYITGKDPSAYVPERMTDGNEQTAWQFSTKTSKLKETYAYFTFIAPVSINQLWIKNGFWTITKGFDQYTRNSRPKEIGVAFRYEGSDEWQDKQTIKLKDDKKRVNWQKVDLGQHQNVTAIRFRIISIYKGTKFPSDVCISEVMFVEN